YRATGERLLLAHLPEAEAETLVVQADRRSADDLQRFFHLLLEADEALSLPARTVDPQLVLEMHVLRLATLPPLLPSDGIRRRLAAPGPGAGGPATAGTVSGRPRRKSQAGPARQAVAADQLWERFLARVREEKIALYMTLAAAKPTGIDGEALR